MQAKLKEIKKMEYEEGDSKKVTELLKTEDEQKEKNINMKAGFS